MSKLINEELSGTIIGVAMEVLKELKPGLDEKLYKWALTIECGGAAMPWRHSDNSRCCIINESIGYLTPDLMLTTQSL
jgi:hypothetical protein